LAVHFHFFLRWLCYSLIRKYLSNLLRVGMFATSSLFSLFSWLSFCSLLFSSSSLLIFAFSSFTIFNCWVVMIMNDSFTTLEIFLTTLRLGIGFNLLRLPLDTLRTGVFLFYITLLNVLLSIVSSLADISCVSICGWPICEIMSFIETVSQHFQGFHTIESIFNAKFNTNLLQIQLHF